MKLVMATGASRRACSLALAVFRHTFNFLSESATIKRQSPSPKRLQECIQGEYAFKPETGSFQASSHTSLAGAARKVELSVAVRILARPACRSPSPPSPSRSPMKRYSLLVLFSYHLCSLLWSGSEWLKQETQLLPQSLFMQVQASWATIKCN